MENTNIDLFDNYESLPVEVKNILERFSDIDLTYENCSELVLELENIGYTCDYYLDAVPFNLKKIINK